MTGKLQKAVKRLWKDAEGFVLPALFGILIIAFWEKKVFHALLGVKVLQLPIPSRITAVFLENAQRMAPDSLATLNTALSGMILGSLAGFAVALIATMFPKWGAGALTLLSAMNAVPVVALSPIMNVWFADAESAKTAVVAIVCMVAMAANAFRGMNDTKQFALDLMKSYAGSKRQIFLKLRLPNSVPYVFTGLRINVAAAMIGAIVSEYFSPASKGLGYGIRNRLSTGQFPLGWAYIIAASLIGIALYAAVAALERWATTHRQV